MTRWLDFPVLLRRSASGEKMVLFMCRPVFRSKPCSTAITTRTHRMHIACGLRAPLTHEHLVTQHAKDTHNMFGMMDSDGGGRDQIKVSLPMDGRPSIVSSALKAAGATCAGRLTSSDTRGNLGAEIDSMQPWWRLRVIRLLVYRSWMIQFHNSRMLPMTPECVCLTEIELVRMSRVWIGRPGHVHAGEGSGEGVGALLLSPRGVSQMSSGLFATCIQGAVPVA